MSPEATPDALWRRCSSCKNPIEFETPYWVCNVSTCNRKRTGLIFCDVSCWDAHLSSVNHRESWAVERRAPSRSEWATQRAAEARAASSEAERPRRRVVASAPPPKPRAARQVPQEILIVASRLRNYIYARAGMKTAESVLSVLSDRVREVCDEAIRNAERAERKTVLERDVPRR